MPRSPQMKRINDILWFRGNLLFFTMIGFSLWGLLGFDTPFNAPFIWCWRHLTLPILGLGWLYGYSQRHYFLRDRGMRKSAFWVVVVLGPILSLIFSGGIVSLVNASFPTAQTVTYRGPILKKDIAGGRSKEHIVSLQDQVSAEKITLVVSASEYSKLSIGQTYSRDMKIGLLGIPFRVKYQ